MRVYTVGLDTLGKVHVSVTDAHTSEILDFGIWSVSEIEAALGFLRERLLEDAHTNFGVGRVNLWDEPPRISPEMRSDIDPIAFTLPQDPWREGT